MYNEPHENPKELEHHRDGLMRKSSTLMGRAPVYVVRCGENPLRKSIRSGKRSLEAVAIIQRRVESSIATLSRFNGKDLIWF